MSIVSCGTGLTFNGPQLYYRVTLSAGKWYRLALQAEFAAALYVANGNTPCTGDALKDDCASVNGTVVLASGAPTAPGTTATAFRPPVGGEYTVALPAAGASLVCFLLNLGLLRYVYRLDR